MSAHLQTSHELLGVDRQKLLEDDGTGCYEDMSKEMKEEASRQPQDLACRTREMKVKETLKCCWRES